MTLDKTLEVLEDGLSELFDSERYKTFLTTMAKFHNYSLNNCILIAQQRPDATLVAGYTAWRDKFKRQVMKGERGMTIIAPSPQKRTVEKQILDSEGLPVFDSSGQPVMSREERTFNSFRVARVFDVSQTEGQPIPEIVRELTNPISGFDDYMEAIQTVSPVTVRFDEISTDARGYFSPASQEIVIQRGMSEDQTIKTCFHEIAHALLGHGGKDDSFNRREREVQAESVAFCVCRAFGINTDDYSFGYIAGWSSGRDIKELKSSLNIIRDTADRMISSMSEKLDELKIRSQVREVDLSMAIDKSAIGFSF